MQVTRDTFPAVFPRFVELLQTCDFFAFDEEMTGINTAELPELITDTPEESYRAKRTVASRYNIIQVGICLFHKENNTRDSPALVRYVARPFNFVLFPNHTDDFKLEERSSDVVLSPSSLAFLRKHEMDFQSWVYKGIAYCDSSREDALRKKHEEKYQSILQAHNNGNKETWATDLMTEDERKWFANAVSSVEAFALQVHAAFERAKEKYGESLPGIAGVAATIDLTQSGGRELFLPPQRSKNAREALEKHVASHFQNVLLRFRRQGASYIGVIRSVFPDERARLLEKDQALKERELMNMLGFRMVFKALSESRKPCVGHNCFADILFLLASMDNPLPESLPHLKQRIRELFPTVFDTRYIASRQDFFPMERFGSRYLSGFFEEYGFRSANVHVTLPLGFEVYDTLVVDSRDKNYGHAAHCGGGGPVHEAGYDALLTGTLLLNLLAELGGYDVATAPECVVNRVALFRSLYAISLMDAEGDEYLPEDGVLELRHENSLKTHHIDNCFQTLSLRNVTLYQVNETCTLAVLPPKWFMECGREKMTVELLSTHITSRFPQFFEASVYQPKYAPTTPKGVLRVTPPALARTVLRSVLR